MNKYNFISLALSLLLTAPSLAGTEGKGGGKGVFCPMSDGSRVLIKLDYERAVHEWRRTLRFAPGATAIEKAVNIIRRLAPLDPVRAHRYEAMARQFDAAVDWQANRKYRIVDDSSEINYCAGGELQQIVVQAPILMETPIGMLYQSPRFVFSGSLDLKMQMDLDQYAGMIIHEVVLRDAKLHGVALSDNASIFNTLLTSDDIRGLSPQEYAQQLRNLELTYTRAKILERIQGEEGKRTLKSILKKLGRTNTYGSMYMYTQGSLFVAVSQNDLLEGKYQNLGLYKDHDWFLPNSLGQIRVPGWFRNLTKEASALAEVGLKPDEYAIFEIGVEFEELVLLGLKVVHWTTPIAWLDIIPTPKQ